MATKLAKTFGIFIFSYFFLLSSVEPAWARLVQHEYTYFRIMLKGTPSKCLVAPDDLSGFLEVSTDCDDFNSLWGLVNIDTDELVEYWPQDGEEIDVDIFPVGGSGFTMDNRGIKAHASNNPNDPNFLRLTLADSTGGQEFFTVDADVNDPSALPDETILFWGGYNSRTWRVDSATGAVYCDEDQQGNFTLDIWYGEPVSVWAPIAPGSGPRPPGPNPF